MVEWRSIPGFRRYWVSNDGQVRRVNGRWMRLGMWGNTVVVALVNDQGVSETCNLARLVLEAFVGSCPPGLQCCHYPDRDRRNNRLQNLRWGTPKENSGDRVRHGTQIRGENLHFARLDEKSVMQIRSDYARGGVTQKQLAARYRVHPHTVYLIIKGKTWTHLPLDGVARNFSSRRGNGWKKLRIRS